MISKIKSFVKKITNKDINDDAFKRILSIEQEFGYQSGRWAENEYLQSEIACAEFSFITTECDELKFKYIIDWEIIHDIAEDYDEEVISESDIIQCNVTNDNYWQFDALASDIEYQLISYLKKQL